MLFSESSSDGLAMLSRGVITVDRGIDCLPDELLSRVLTHLDFRTKLRSHRVRRRWNDVLKHPCCEAVWGSIPKLDQGRTPDENDCEVTERHAT